MSQIVSKRAMRISGIKKESKTCTCATKILSPKFFFLNAAIRLHKWIVKIRHKWSHNKEMFWMKANKEPAITIACRQDYHGKIEVCVLFPQKMLWVFFVLASQSSVFITSEVLVTFDQFCISARVERYPGWAKLPETPDATRHMTQGSFLCASKCSATTKRLCAVFGVSPP